MTADRGVVDGLAVRASPGLRALVGQVWGAPGAQGVGTEASPVRVTDGRRPGDGYRVAESYVVVPSLEHARLLVPADSRRAAVAFLRQNLMLRPRRLRWTRSALSTAFEAGMAGALVRDRVVVWVDESVGPAQLPDHLVSAHLARVLDVARLYLGIGVRAPDPNHKPSLQLFNATGRSLGYAKVGWNDTTRALVTNEAAVLQALTSHPPRLLTLPRSLYGGSWAGRSLLVASPLPTNLRQYVTPHEPPAAALMSDLAGPARHRSELRSSPYWLRTVTAAHSVAEDLGHGELAAALLDYVAAVEEGWGAVEVELGRWHGDLVPWNVGHCGSRLHVWDWEHSESDMPLGLDLAHWHFQVAFVTLGSALPDALRAAQRAPRQAWVDLGLTEEQGRLVGVLYVIEVALRAYRLMRGGGGWDPRMYPVVLEALRTRPQPP